VRIAQEMQALYDAGMKALSVRLPDRLFAEIAAEAKKRRMSKSAVVRERLQNVPKAQRRPAMLEAVADLIGSIDDLPPDLSARKKFYLRRAFKAAADGSSRR
jgi:hypothetical protein